MYLIIKFKNGDEIAIPVADYSSGYWDLIVYLREIEKNKSPFSFVLENGATYKSNGAEMLSVELKFK